MIIINLKIKLIMKHIKHFAFGLMGVAVLTVGLYACSNEDTTNMQQEESANTVRLKSGNDFEGGQIGLLENGIAVPLYDEVKVKASLIHNETFESIESIELAYGVNPDGNKEEAFVTIIGVEKATSQVVGIVVDLVIDGDKLIIPNPETNQQSFAAHSCTGSNCSYCQFDRNWFLGRIKGCKPCSRPGDDSLPSYCNHGTSSGGIVPIIQETSKVLVKSATGL